MTGPRHEITETEKELKAKFNKEEASKRRFPTSASPSQISPSRLDSLALPDSQRPKMPLTKEKFTVRENPLLIAWERETRKFLRQLSPDHAHRVAATMVYEWVTGIEVREAMKATAESGSQLTRVRSDLRVINKCLKFYFGRPYMTTIAGRKVPRCYTVKKGTYIKRRRPMTLQLWAEWKEGSLPV